MNRCKICLSQNKILDKKRECMECKIKIKDDKKKQTTIKKFE